MRSLKVVKVGGNVVDNEDVLIPFLQAYAQLEGPKILVHGGGKIATKISAALGIETQMIEGRRVTNQETIKVVTMVYAGLINKKIVAKLQSNGVNAIGLSGADANVIKSHKRVVKSVDYGFVGDVDEVNALFLTSLIEDEVYPVMAPITHNKEGQLLNTNADTIASTIAVAMAPFYKTELMYCFELPGVLKDINNADSLITKLNPQEYETLKTTGIIADGMIPKLDNCFDAIASGVDTVRICHADNLNNLVGTNLTK